jgi:hypothetical protein
MTDPPLSLPLELPYPQYPSSVFTAITKEKSKVIAKFCTDRMFFTIFNAMYTIAVKAWH